MEYTIVEISRASTHGPYLYSFRGKSTYAKPTLSDFANMATGSVLYDFDIQQAYMYDRDTQTWILQ